MLERRVPRAKVEAMGTRRTKALLGVGIPVLVVALIVGAWAIDTRGASGTVPRNVRLAGHDVGRMTEAKVAAIVRDIGKQYASTEVEVSTPQGSYKVPAGKLGLTLDEKATVQTRSTSASTTTLPCAPSNGSARSWSIARRR